MTESPALFDVCTELAGLLREHGQFERELRRREPVHFGPGAALDEMDAWLRDSRTYDPANHKKAWRSVTADVVSTLQTRGHRLAQVVPSLDALVAQLKPPLLGADAQRRAAAAALIATTRRELAAEDALLASFDDLFKAVSDVKKSRPRLTELINFFYTCVTFAMKRSGSLLDRLAGVLLGQAYDVKLAQNLCGEEVEFNRSDVHESVDLPIPGRQRLCREMIKARAAMPTASEIVWVCYDNARIRFPLDLGPLTFYDKEHLVQIARKEVTELAHAVNKPDDVSGFKMVPTPSELDDPLSPADDGMIWPGWPPHLDNFVAVRVDLGHLAPIDPVAEARRQAENAVRTAGFYNDGTSWRLITGHIHFRDGQMNSVRAHQPDRSLDRDETGWTIQHLERRLGGRMPISEHRLQEVLDCVAILDIRRNDLDPSAILHTARVIDKMAGICDAPDWTSHLVDNFSIAWAKDQVMDLIHSTGWAIRHEETLDLSSIPAAEKLSKSWYEIDLAVAVECIAWLNKEIDPHHKLAREIRDIASWTSSPANLHQIVKRFVADYRVLVDRLLRCRNSLAHGGPFVPATGKTVVRMSWVHAKRTTATTLDALLDNVEPGQAHQDKRTADQQWLQGIPRLTKASQAFA